MTASSGYGRLHRDDSAPVGIVDVEDAMAAARSLADSGRRTNGGWRSRGSAGGWTALAAVTTGAARGSVFSAAASYFELTCAGWRSTAVT